MRVIIRDSCRNMNICSNKEAESGHDAGVVRVDSLESLMASMEE